MSDLTVRRFRPGDGPAVRDLNRTALRAAGDFVEDAPETDLQDVPGHYLEGEFLVGAVDGDVVATVAYRPASEWFLADRFSFDRPTALLTRLRVHPDYHRRGYASRLCDELERRARSDGYDQLVLDVSEDNDAARAFYEDRGFAYEETVEFEALGRTFRPAVYRKSFTGTR